MTNSKGCRTPNGLATLFDTHADIGGSTAFHLSRPFDIAPGRMSYTVGELASLVQDAAGWLYAAGARPGDRVAMVKDNHWDYVLLACAAARLGAVPAMVSDRLPAESLRMLLKRLEPTLLVTNRRVLDDARCGGQDLVDAASRTLVLDGPAPGAVTLDDVRGAPTPAPRPRAADQPMIVTHTSGTTGVPKLVVHSANTVTGHLGRTESIRWPVVAMRRDDTVAISVAFSHTRIVPWTSGVLRLRPRAAVLIADSGPDEAARTLREHPPTHVEALPHTYLRWEPLAAQKRGVFTNVRLYVSTFDAMHPPTVRRYLRRRFPLWFQGWGQSETGPLTFRTFTRRAVSRIGERNPATRDAGRPIPTFTALRVVDPSTMRDTRPGQPGIVLARTRGRCLTYLGEEHRWQAKAHGSWWNTGDIGVKTRTGRFRLLDREVDALPGASCVELEDVLADRIPSVLEAVVLYNPDGPPLPVLCTSDGEPDPAVWAAATRDLPPLAAPVTVPWEGIPRTGTGKVRRRELQERLLGRADTFGSGRWT